MLVRIRYKTGSVRLVPTYTAKRLVERRIADYYAEQPPAAAPAPAVAPVAPATAPAPVAPAPEPTPPDLDALTRDELYALAVERGLEPHHKTGADKLRAMLR